jgi:hypothetical protein
MYLCAGAQSFSCKSQPIEPMLGLLPEIHYELIEMNKDGFFKGKEEEDDMWEFHKERERFPKRWRVTSHLSLAKWTQHERQRRKEEATKQNVVSSDQTSSLTYKEQIARHTLLDQMLWAAVVSDDLAAAKKAYKQGACADLWYAAGIAVRYAGHGTQHSGFDPSCSRDKERCKPKTQFDTGLYTNQQYVSLVGGSF